MKNTEVKTEETTYKSDSTTQTKRDSTYDRTYFEKRDSSITIQKDSATIRALIECRKGKARIKSIHSIATGRKVKLNISLENNILMGVAVVDSFEVAFQYFNKHTDKYVLKEIDNNQKSVEITEKSYYEKVTKIVKRVPWWVWSIIIGVGAYFAIKFGLPLIRKALLGI